MTDVLSRLGPLYRKALRSRRNRRWALAVDHVGERLSFKGKPTIVNQGRITFGDDFFLSSDPVPSHITATDGGTVRIGDRVHISYGAAIAARIEIQIGADTRIGPFVVIMDSDFHRPGDRDAPGGIGPVRIGSGVTIGARVSILRGTTIGNDATVLSGSMVSGDVAAGATVRGVPARGVFEGRTGHEVEVSELVRAVLGLSKRPSMSEGPNEIPEWDSLGALRLLLAVEETYGIRVREEDFHAAATVDSLSDLIEASR